MKNKKNLFITIGAVLLLIATAVSLYFIFRDKNKLSIDEKNWLNNNQHVLIDFRLVNDVDTFGVNGGGVFFDFIADLEEKYNLNINPVTYSYGAFTSGLTFNIGTAYAPEDIVFYKDHFVVINKDEKVITSIYDLTGKNVGILNAELTYISYYLNDLKATFTQLDSKEGLASALESCDFVIAPLNLYLGDILKNKYFINYHLSDINQYYYLSLGENKTLASIIKKYYNVWNKEEFDKSYYRNLFSSFTSSLSITDVEIHELTSKEYTYATVEYKPYEVMKSGKLGGINHVILSKFAKMTNVDFKYSKYKNYAQLDKAIKKNKVDLYFNNSKFDNDLILINTLINIKYEVIAKNTNDFVASSISSLKGKNVYIEDSSPLYEYFKTQNIATVKTYKNENELKRVIKDGEIIIIDTNVYNTLINTSLKNVTSRYSASINLNTSFKIKTSDVFTKLFSNFARFLDSKELVVEGASDYYEVVSRAGLFEVILDYLIYLIPGALIISYVIFRISKRTKIVKRIKKEDKMKYIDILTSLKNRNYLNENIEKWDQNTIYPQCIMIIDLNNIKYINDTYGHEEGDKQIKASAGILIKTQLDNTEIIRTDGNEFLVYLIGYEEKQIGSYIRKLSKEFNKLPYNYGAALGYTMIADDLKLIDDAINEATIDMRANKDKEEK